MKLIQYTSEYVEYNQEKLNKNSNYELIETGVFGKYITEINENEYYKLKELKIDSEEKPPFKNYLTVRVIEKTTKEQDRVINSGEAEDDFWSSEIEKEYLVNIEDTKEMLQEMHTYHYFNRNFFKSIKPRVLKKYNNWKDERYSELQTKLMKTLNHTDRNQKDQISKCIRNLSYSK